MVHTLKWTRYIECSDDLNLAPFRSNIFTASLQVVTLKSEHLRKQPWGIII